MGVVAAERAVDAIVKARVDSIRMNKDEASRLNEAKNDAELKAIARTVQITVKEMVKLRDKLKRCDRTLRAKNVRLDDDGSVAWTWEERRRRENIRHPNSQRERVQSLQRMRGEALARLATIEDRGTVMTFLENFQQQVDAI